ncbi:hypothetical protein Q4544_14460 [Cognatishimia sp. 1_MG-2023]|uniref:hypothetical protein n=1 Tax=Cognatishimia sp. 1_MG-2023 TaxID=3062642 RepID=UPI0026E4099C|nr:hypothetical protein [Cognatishimia sp. 1_MG-2023]MDO6728138.1 hypothetical protein [Cognatishimia sp. 1_MG-2023]
MKQLFALITSLALLALPFQTTAQESGPFINLLKCLNDTPYSKNAEYRSDAMATCVQPILEQCLKLDYKTVTPEIARAGYSCLSNMSSELQSQMHNDLHAKFPDKKSMAHQLRKLPMDHGLATAELGCEYVRTFANLRFKPWLNDVAPEDSYPSDVAKAHCLLQEHAELYWYIFVHDHME